LEQLVGNSPPQENERQILASCSFASSNATSMQVRTLKYVSHFARYVRCALHTRYNCCCANCRTFCTEAPAQCVCMVRLCPCSRLTRDKLNPSHSQSFLSLSSYDKLLCSSVNSKTTCAICTNICATLHKYMCNLHKYVCNLHKYLCNLYKYVCKLHKYVCKFPHCVLHAIHRSYELTRLNVQILNIRQYSVLIIKYIILY